MNDCDKYLEAISAYLDNGIMDDELNEHLESCPACRVELSNMKNLVSKLNSLPELDLPEGFHERAMDRLILETRAMSESSKDTIAKRSVKTANIFSKGYFSRYAAVAASVLLCFVLAGGALTFVNRGILNAPASTAAGTPMPTSPMAAPAAASAVQTPQVLGESIAPPSEAPAQIAPASGAASGDGLAVPAPAADVRIELSDGTELEGFSVDLEEAQWFFRHDIIRSDASIARRETVQGDWSSEPLITAIPGVHSNHSDLIARTTSISLRADDINTVVSAIRQAGYEIESSDISPLWGFGHLSLRVPAYFQDMVIEYIKSLGKTTFERENAVDLTHETNELALMYFTRREESQRLSALINTAERAEDILLLQSRISQIERERARIRGSYNLNINNVHNTTVILDIYIDVPAHMQPEQSFAQRMGTAFTGSINISAMFFEGILVFLSHAFLPFIIIAVLVAVAYKVYKKFGKRGQKNEKAG